MNIKTWMQLIIFVTITIAIIVGVINYNQKNQLSKSMEKRILASEIVRVVNQRENILNDYLNYHEKENIIQWQIMYDITVRLLQSKEFNGEDEQFILADMRENNVDINNIFTQLIVLQEPIKTSKENQVKIRSHEEKLRNSLLEKGESIISGAYRLTEISRQNSMSILKRSNIYTIGSIIILIMLVSFILLLFRLNIVNPLMKLNEGIKIIRSGNLDYHVATHKNDEIGEIIHSFNEMTHELNHKSKALKFTNERLEKSNKELNQFAYIASHDLQEPLRVISNYLQLIELRYKGKIDQDANEFIEFAVKAAQRLQMMIQDLLLFSRVETQGEKFAPVDLEEILKDVQDNLQMAINENQATITHDHLPTINADTMQMNMLLQNLISNAIKFHTNDPPKVHISAKKNNDEWIFGVHDNGIGIAAKDKEKLFSIFKRLVGKEYPGTGIGLALCKRIVDRHNGRIWAESELGKGSTFYFSIPIEPPT